MYPNRTKKRIRTTLGFTLSLIIFNLIVSFSYATQWSPDTRLTWDDSRDFSSSIVQAQDGRIWIVWHSFESDSNSDILYKVYNGSSTFPWSPIKRLTTDQGDDFLPSITTTSDSDIWVVWSSDRDENSEIYYKIYNGSSWSFDTRLTTDPSEDKFPSVMEDKDGDIWVVWSSSRTGNFKIHYQVFNGSSWQPCGQLTSNGESDEDPSIMQAQDGRFWLVWVRDEDLYYKVFFKNMTDIVLDTLLTENGGLTTDWHPSIMQTQDGRIWIAWGSLNMQDEMDVYCKIYNGSWSQERITYDTADDYMPSIMQTNDGTIWIAWTSNRFNNFDIYYKTDSPPQHFRDIAIISVTHDPNVTVAYRGLNINIEVVLQNQGVEDEYVQVNCSANSTLIESQTIHLSAGQLMPINFAWNTSNVNAGTYTIIANVSITGEIDTDPADNTFIDGIIEIRILGDIVGMHDEVLLPIPDGQVDLDDFMTAVGQFGTAYPTWNPVWGPVCDVNDDEVVDIDDLMIIALHYGET